MPIIGESQRIQKIFHNNNITSRFQFSYQAVGITIVGLAVMERTVDLEVGAVVFVVVVVLVVVDVGLVVVDVGLVVVDVGLVVVVVVLVVVVVVVLVVVVVVVVVDGATVLGALKFEKSCLTLPL